MVCADLNGFFTAKFAENAENKQMREIKHPFSQGVNAQKGIEF